MTLPTPGSRVSLRWLDGSGQAHDLVGEVVEAGRDGVRILPWDRGPVTVHPAAIVAWRPVPPKAVRPSSPPADVARLAARGWPGLEVERLGGWELRASGGYTRRANSALCEGDPGLSVARAVDLLVEFYRARDLPPQVMLAARPGEHHPLEGRLVDQGWRAHSHTWLMSRDLRVGQDEPLPTGVDASWSQRPDAAWLAAFGRPHPLQLAVLTAADADYLSLVGAGELIAIARLAPTDDWAGISALWVAPAHRGRGLGTAVLGALRARAVSRGARFGYLQVMADNPGARRLYERLGWQVHHGYTYLTRDPAPGGADD